MNVTDGGVTDLHGKWWPNAEAGRFDAAVAEQERAIKMLRAAGRDDEVADFQNRLGLYRYGQPYRD